MMYNIGLINEFPTNLTTLSPTNRAPHLIEPNLLAPFTSNSAIENIEYVNYAETIVIPKNNKNYKKPEQVKNLEKVNVDFANAKKKNDKKRQAEQVKNLKTVGVDLTEVRQENVKKNSQTS